MNCLLNRGDWDLAIIIWIDGFTGKTYCADPTRILTRFESCPLCKRRLARNGSYPRCVLVSLSAVATVIYRKRCRPCRTSFSLLPDFMLPGTSYDRHFIVAWLSAWLQGASCRSRSFFEEHGVTVPEEAGMSWSDLLDAVDVRPRYQQLHRWSRTFSLRARQALASLVAVAGILNAGVGAGLAAVAQLPAPPQALPLVTALALFIAVEGTLNTNARVELSTALFRLVGYLVLRPPPSHKLRRASGRDSRYYGLVI